MERGWIVLVFLSALGLAGCLSPGVPDPASLQDATSRWVQVEGVRVHLRDTGPPAGGGPVLLLIHGYLGSSYSYRELLARLAPAGRLIAVDLPGFGLSAKPDIRYTLGFFLGFLDRLRGNLGLGRVVLVGHSFGGCLALHYAARRPEAVAGLVLIAPDGLEGEEGRYGWLRRSRLLVGLAALLNNRATLAWGMRRHTFHDSRRVTPAQVDSVAATALSPEGRRAQARIARDVVGRHPVDRLLPVIAAPVLLIWGEEDRVLPVRWAGRFLERLPRARLWPVPDAGHLPQVEAPERTADGIRAFLGEPSFRAAPGR